ncbi:hypothetical protein N6H18_00725 [Reichenbachiella agarivorans]|uniref:DUF2157 domain-containing protein n=1 Tax=Reichenbachiella agarivorans TaxID=2979464 RepID=A0ABY6CPQ1_9BACT|nr:hypothetical protein [Reichenbachiella agarivorans]UXP32499.1 hypothetical protein N6H18_00725 [Reichenbachiella agarivorans]
MVAYDLEEVRKKLSLSKIKTWYKQGWINEEQWSVIREQYQTKLYSPSVIMRILLFVVTLIGISTVLTPFAFAFEIDSEIGIRVMMVLVGIASLLFTELKMIKDSHHYKSGVTEAGYYVGGSFLFLGVLGFDMESEWVYIAVAFLFLVGASIRYMDLLALGAAVLCFVYLLFYVFTSVIAFLPFLVMIVFAGLFFLSQRLQKVVDGLIWEDHFIIFDTMALMLIYLGGNYFVVREMSVGMLGVEVSEGGDIPFAFLFYAFTFLIPVGYLVWGIVKKEILFIRVSLLTLTLSVITIKYYYGLDYPEVTVTIAGAVMILAAIGVMNYLKIDRKGFTREPLVQSKWENSDMTAFIASQTLGGHQIQDDGFSGQGGTFGGGGASGEF